MLKDISIDQDWYPGEDDVEKVLVLKNKLAKDSESDRFTRLICRVLEFLIVQKIGGKSVPELLEGTQESDKEGSTGSHKRVLPIFKQSLHLSFRQMHEHEFV
jgi:hypothetical protein